MNYIQLINDGESLMDTRDRPIIMKQVPLTNSSRGREKIIRKRIIAEVFANNVYCSFRILFSQMVFNYIYVIIS